MRFVVFNKASTPGILTNRFTTLDAGPQGELWLGSEGGSVTRYTRNGVATYTSAHGLPASVLWGFTGDGGRQSVGAVGREDSPLASVARAVRRRRRTEVSRATASWRAANAAASGPWHRRGCAASSTGTFQLHPMPQALLDDAVYLAEEQDGTLWTATADGRVARIDTQIHAGLRGLDGDSPRHADHGG